MDTNRYESFTLGYVDRVTRNVETEETVSRAIRDCNGGFQLNTKRIAKPQFIRCPAASSRSALAAG